MKTYAEKLIPYLDIFNENQYAKRGRPPREYLKIYLPFQEGWDNYKDTFRNAGFTVIENQKEDYDIIAGSPKFNELQDLISNTCVPFVCLAPIIFLSVDTNKLCANCQALFFTGLNNFFLCRDFLERDFTIGDSL